MKDQINASKILHASAIYMYNKVWKLPDHYVKRVINDQKCIF